MAIAFARARYLSRATGGNAVRSAAYNARESITAERTGELFHFRHRDAPEHHEVLLPEGADARFKDCAVLWNAAERRKDSQVAREIVLALPADRVLSTEDRIELARSFAEQHFVSKGLAVQLDVHAPHKDRGEGEGAYAEGTGGDHTNWHAHLLITTRRIEGDQLSAKKARDLDPEVRKAGARSLVTDAEAWGETWRAHQDRYFQEHGIELRVDATAAYPGEHIGPVRMRKVDSPAMERAEALRTANEAAARDPEQVLAALTRNNATFTEREVERYLAKHFGTGSDGPDGAPDTAILAEIAATKTAVLGHRDVVALYDRETGEVAGRFTTLGVRVQERTALADGAAVAQAGHHTGVTVRHQEAALASRTLRDDQRTAFEHAVSRGGLKLIEGRAGTGKSYTLAAVRDAHERVGYRVVGLAPTNAVAQDLKADGFAEAGTVHSALFQLKNGRMTWDRRTVLVVDEAAMLDSRVTGEVLAEARAAGAKVILTGDDRQLASIERGGLFTELRKAHGAAEITELTRQKVGWQRQAARDLAEGRFDAAVQAFDRHGAVTWTVDEDASRATLVERWKADSLASPEASRFVFAYTNAEVNRLNAELREVRRDRGELQSPDTELTTRHGEAGFAVGDRVQFTDTAKKLGVYNGNAGVITQLDPETGRVQVRLDAAAGAAGRMVSWSAADGFEGFRHGYAGTIYKGQGKTLDHTYLLHTKHWRAAASYVALTRQRESAQVFVATETARDVQQLARQMGRGEVKAASVAWAAAGEVAALRAAAASTARDSVRPAPDSTKRTADEPSRPDPAEGRATEANASRPALPPMPQDTPVRDGWLIPPYVDPAGQDRDSLGRGVTAGEIAAAVAANKSVQLEREARWSYLRGAYKDPHAARAALDEVVKREGWTSAASRIAREPNQLGELRGKTGWLTSGAAKAERLAAERAAGALPGSLQRIGDAEGAAERVYRASVEAQHVADRTGVPRLLPDTEAVLVAIRAAPDEAVRGRIWHDVEKTGAIAKEIDAFRAAVEHRLGVDSIRHMLRTEGRAGAVSAPSVTASQRTALNQVAERISTIRSGERAGADLTQKQEERERLTQRRGLRM